MGVLKTTWHLPRCQAAHFSIFRVNGDANYMKDAFYDLCDELASWSTSR